MDQQTKHISFTKMEGAGNDFVVLDNRSGNLTKEQIVELAPKICNRKYGVGSDGILALFPAEKENVDYTMFYRNPDGSDAGMCGNGARCIALFAHSLGFDSEHRFNVHDQMYKAEVESPEQIRISFPIDASVKKISLNGRQLYETYTGTEHIALPVEEDLLYKEDHLKDEGHSLRYHAQFHPKGTNVNFIYGIDDTTLRVQTYERGVEDLTLACGTGVIASALVWHHLQETSSSNTEFNVKTSGGSLNVYFSFDNESKKYSNIKLEGPAHFVFKGKYLL